MTLSLIALLAIVHLAIGTAAIYMALIPIFPVGWLYVHARVRKPLTWVLLTAQLGLSGWALATDAVGLGGALPFVLLSLLATVLTYKMHQSVAFPAVDYPAEADDPMTLPLSDERQCALIEYNGVSRVYPLDYVIHHHVVNDRFGDAIVSLTYCAMCRTVIAFDVTDLGPLYVGSFKQANMIVADRATHTWFQQATFDSIMGPKHPHPLKMVPSALMAWEDVKALDPMPAVVAITPHDLRRFELPIPGVWRKIVASEATPGLGGDAIDKAMPARTHVIGVVDPAVPAQVYIKEEVLERGVVQASDGNFFLVGVNDAVSAFKTPAGNAPTLSGRQLRDESGDRTWDLRGRSLDDGAPLERIALSDEYWFSWRYFHPNAPVMRLGA